MPDLITRDAAKEAIKGRAKKYETAPNGSFEHGVYQGLMMALNEISALAAIPAAEGEWKQREYAELVRLCRNLLDEEWPDINLDPIGEFITELNANGFIADLAASNPNH